MVNASDVRLTQLSFGGEGLQGPVPRRGAVFEVRHAASGLHAFIALHGEGPCFGGIRRHAYPTPAAAQAEAQALAEAMSWKVTLAGLGVGGAKAVVLDHPELEVLPAYEALGHAIAALEGRYFGGPDMGTGEAELGAVRVATAHINSAVNHPSASTAAGVLAGVDAALAVRGESLQGAVATVQGLGGVGARVAAGLHARGARLFVADVRAEAARHLGVPATRLPGRALLAHPAALHAPCAVGHTLYPRARLGPGIVCGAANVQLRSPETAAALHRAGVLWCPDWLVNAGAVIEGVMVAQGRDRDAVQAALSAIGPRTHDVLSEARRRDVSPRVVALERCGAAPRP